MTAINRRTFIAGIGASALALGLAGCSSSSSSNNAAANNTAASNNAAANNTAAASKTITIAATPTPHAEVLEDVVVGLLAKEGITLDVREYNDYVLPNTAVEDGELDANYFQHINYLDSFNEEKGTHLVSVGYVHYEPFGLYAGKKKALSDLAEGDTIAIPNDTTNEARALLLLQQEGLLKLKDGAGVTATPNDIVENPKSLKFQELEAAQVSRSLEDVAFGIINGNYALGAGLSIADALAIESADGLASQQYGNILVVKEGNEKDEAIQALYKALTSTEVSDYMKKTYGGAVVPLF